LESGLMSPRAFHPGSKPWIAPHERLSKLAHAEREVLGELELILDQEVQDDERERAREGGGAFGLRLDTLEGGDRLHHGAERTDEARRDALSPERREPEPAARPRQREHHLEPPQRTRKVALVE